MSMGKGRASNKLSYKEALPQAQNPINFTECFWLRKGFSFVCIHVASSLKPLSQTHCGPNTSYFLDKQSMVEIPVQLSFKKKKNKKTQVN